jgi:hypothetical protein
MDYGLGLRASGVLDNLFQLLKTFPDLQQFTRQKNATRLFTCTPEAYKPLAAPTVYAPQACDQGLNSNERHCHSNIFMYFKISAVIFPALEWLDISHVLQRRICGFPGDEYSPV